MNKRLTFLIIILILVTIVSCFVLAQGVNKNPNTSSVTASTSTPVSKTSTTNSGSLGSGIRVSFNFADFFTGETTLNKSSTFASPQSGIVVSFKLLADKAHQAVNSTYDSYVNQDMVGEVGGEGETMIGFSPDNRYFAIRSRYNEGCEGDCQNFEIYVIDTSSKKVLEIDPPHSSKDYLGDKSLYDSGSSFIASSTWSGSDTLKITYFFIGNDKNTGKLYRISPQEIWNYNLTNAKYTLVQTLPE